MYIFGYLFLAVATVLDYVLIIFMWIVVARAILSWVSPDPFNPIVRFIYNVSEPVLSRIKRYIPVNFGGIDFSPILVFMGVIFLRIFLVSSLKQFAQALL
jgi:YggT family protein